MKKVMCDNGCGTELEVADNVFVAFCHDCYIKNIAKTKKMLGEKYGR